MAKAKKKAAKKPARKAVKKKTIAKRKPVASRGKSTKRTVRKSSRGVAPSGVQLGVSLDLDARLRGLATQMNKSLEEVLIQALTEFADNWEDHLRTVKTLNAGDDRMQLAVMDDDNQP
jgi:hypothetical protein